MTDVRLATTTDLPVIEATLGLAFADDPVWCWLIGRRKRPVAHMGAILGAITSLRLDESTVWMTDDGAAVAVWAAPKRWKISPTRLLRRGGGTLAKAGPGVFARFLKLGEMERRHPTDEHWYLEILGTRPDRQGEGLGSALIKHRLESDEAVGLPAYLESSKESNLAFYGRHGFAVRGDTIDMPGGGPSIWPMWREAG
jgi:GNAT superfamily N-acetyltransferase